MDDNVYLTKFCKHCGEKIKKDAVVCTHCGRQVETISNSNTQPNIIINNANANTNTNATAAGLGMRPKNKMTTLLLCLFLGWAGAHKFYENKIGLGILYFFTFGLFGVGITIDLITIILKPDIYYV